MLLILSVSEVGKIFWGGWVVSEVGGEKGVECGQWSGYDQGI